MVERMMLPCILQTVLDRTKSGGYSCTWICDRTIPEQCRAGPARFSPPV
jgi:hypothetical protein